MEGGGLAALVVLAVLSLAFASSRFSIHAQEGEAEPPQVEPPPITEEEPPASEQDSPPVTEEEPPVLTEEPSRRLPNVSDGDVYTVSGFELDYESPTADQIPIEEIFNSIEVDLLRTEEGFVHWLDKPEMMSDTIRLGQVPDLSENRFFRSAIDEIRSKILAEFRNREQAVIIAGVDPNDIDREGKDIRTQDRKALRLLVLTGRATEIRTLASGERIPLDDRLDHHWHRRIKERSPIQEGDLIYKDDLDEYIYFLNRRPGRRVDVALSPAVKEGGIALDYLVYENKPWLVYSEISNTGTETTNEWRERFGFVHNQLTNHDDTLSLQYITGGFEEVHAFVGSYEAPVYNLDRLRWQTSGSWSQFDASEVGQFNEQFSGDQWTVGGNLFANIFQHDNLFLDLFGGIRWQNIEVDTESTGIVGEDDFFVPRVGVRVDHREEEFSTLASLDFEFNLANVADTNPNTLDQLGRVNPEDDWYLFHWSIRHSRFLDPLYFGDEWKDPASGKATLAHELVFSVAGQHAFDNRLVPQFEGIIGGLFTARGYPESLAAGDTSVVARLDYLFHLPKYLDRREKPEDLFGREFRWAPQQPYGRADWDLVLRGFFDVGQTVNSARQSFESDDTFVGTGVGLEFLFKRNFRARMDWGIALHGVDAPGNPVDAGDNRFHFVFTFLY